MPQGTPLSRPEKYLQLILRINGLITSLALLAVFMPLERMNQIHQSLGMGPAPAAPIFEYLTRTLSFIYFIHGLLCILLASDVRRYGPIITYVASIELLFAALVFYIDKQTQMPRLWTFIEAPAITFFAATILVLRRISRRNEP